MEGELLPLELRELSGEAWAQRRRVAVVLPAERPLDGAHDDVREAK